MATYLLETPSVPAPRRVRSRLAVGLALASVVWCGGCGRSDKPRLAEAGGIVTYRGQPVADATVVFAPEVGLPAMGQTDAEGRFEFNTQGAPGATIGSGGIAVTAIRQSRELTEEEWKINGPKFEALLESIRSSAIPEKYGHPRTSGLTATVSEDPEKNRFTFDLK